MEILRKKRETNFPQHMVVCLLLSITYFPISFREITSVIFVFDHKILSCVCENEMKKINFNKIKRINAICI